MKKWYKRYESQCWYRNTFLVNRFRDIAKTIKGGEWNNIKDSGCHFVCLSMIIGINPAYMASELVNKQFFKSDRSLEAKKLSGCEGKLVYDQEAPSKPSHKVLLRSIWHPDEGKVDIKISFIAKEKASNRTDAAEIIKEASDNNQHIICGYDDHSRLVAGIKNRNYFLWDPDLTATELQRNINGEYTIKWFFHEYAKDKNYKNKSAEFWV
jgi:hypothetical protein